MKADKVNELYDWTDKEELNPDSIWEMLRVYRRVSDDVFEWELSFDIVEYDETWSGIMCSVYKNIEWKEGYSCVVNWECYRWFDSPKSFVKYIAELYDRAMEILD